MDIAVAIVLGLLCFLALGFGLPRMFLEGVKVFEEIERRKSGRRTSYDQRRLIKSLRDEVKRHKANHVIDVRKLDEVTQKLVQCNQSRGELLAALAKGEVADGD